MQSLALFVPVATSLLSYQAAATLIVAGLSVAWPVAASGMQPSTPIHTFYNHIALKVQKGSPFQYKSTAIIMFTPPLPPGLLV
jgi:hypothetical protein